MDRLLGLFILGWITIASLSQAQTSLVISEVTLTGVTLQSTSSPTTCYTLPTPTGSLDVISLSSARLSRNAQSENQSLSIYFGKNFTVPEYLGALIDGEQYLLDASSYASCAMRMALTIPGNESLVFDETGMHYFNAGCSSVFAVLVDDFLEQIAAMINTTVQRTTSARPAGEKELPITNFTVVIEANAAVASKFRSPHVLFGPSPCEFVSKGDTGGWSKYIWSCEQPGEESAEKQCERTLQAWLRPSNGTSPTFNGDSSFYFLRFIAKAWPTLASLFPTMSSTFGKGLSWLSNVESTIADIVEFGGKDICQHVHADDEYVLALSDPGLSSVYTIGVWNSVPLPTISAIIGAEAQLDTAVSPTKQPPRVVNPSQTGFPTVTVTSFTPVIWSSVRKSGHGGAALSDSVVGRTSGPVALATTTAVKDV
ncbi:hypothetical protein V8F33_009462 [Rhypophila sp. PSN 637]